MTLYHISIKKIIKRCTFSIFAASLLLSSAAFSGCSLKANTAENSDAGSQEPVSATAIKLNTAVTVTIYDSQDRELLTECMNLCDKYEKIFSRTASDSELYQLNHRELTPVAGTEDTFQISDPLAELIRKGLYYSELSEGAFDIAIEPLTSLWDFTAEDPQVPEDRLIQKALTKCDYHNVSVSDNNEVILKTEDTAIELGAIAKGYIADRLKDYLISQGVKSAIINLGGNVLCIGGKPDDSSFKIGIQKPFADRSETIAVMDIKDKSVVSSGVYERCFEQDGTLYHHLLNPRTGYPYDNGLIAVTIISDESVDGDALSTTCFALGLEDGMKLAESLDNVQAFFVTSDYEIHYTKDFQKKITVTETD
ncbi:FAD:protein FMN transferase [Blautia luti]|jgi:thiamine biosynthesis lipoprotein|uniref:FAD:protein FMN transferase n=1 Tax=Blautia luti DSM 14534 = JCM 17040 TaxID=649762 RepID=A0A844GGN5_9FIRM|nr:FAD:protein FMN transferase [Blautia luti]MTD59851.1 FAD:protein FMN transferase [Blautia luti DSM 14534 = JCM 17040]